MQKVWHAEALGLGSLRWITLRDQDCLGTCTVSTHKTEPDQHHPW